MKMVFVVCAKITNNQVVLSSGTVSCHTKLKLNGTEYSSTRNTKHTAMKQPPLLGTYF